ncbi:MAG TPA: LamG-like jellyroll fold domain-containing protein, partial [Candidatus Dormibacteraeota bacterium]|nr:LamG-like jellyroll fold domain-containing protein [Candidatus Dormibacteraeota bacterium]
LATGSSSPNDFAISPDGRTIYFADDHSIASGGGIQRWDDLSLTYTLGTGSGSTVGAHGLVVDFSGFTGGGAAGVGAVLYATTSEAVSNRLIRVTDNSAGSAASLLLSAGPNQTFRGVAFAPTAAPLAITSQPPDHNVYAGGAATFSIGVSGDAPFSYQWKFFGTNLPGATQSSVIISNVQAAKTGGYSCTVSDLHGASTNSRTATLALVPTPSSAYAQAVLQDQPVAWWRLDESPGSTAAHDCVGTHDGTYYSVDLGFPGFFAGDPDTAAFFGTNGILNSYAGSISLDLSGPSNAEFSIEAWFNGGVQTQGAGIVTLGYGSGGEQFCLDNNSSVFRFFVREANASSRTISGGPGGDGNWHHLVGVCDQTNGMVILYVDGVAVGTNTALVPGNGVLRVTGPAAIGARQGGIVTDYNFNSQATIDEVAIYPAALSPSRIAAHFQAGSPVRLALEYVGGQWQLTWPGGGTLQSAGQVTG